MPGRRAESPDCFSGEFQYFYTTFYEEFDKILADRKITDLTMDRIEFAEGGLLSDQRTYLRMQRERLVFDVCTAPIWHWLLLFLPNSPVAGHSKTLACAGTLDRVKRA